MIIITLTGWLPAKRVVTSIILRYFKKKLSCKSHGGWWPNVHLINICHFGLSQLAESESWQGEANLAWGRKSSQLHAEDRMSFLIMEMDREKISNFYWEWKDVCELKSAHRVILVPLLVVNVQCDDKRGDFLKFVLLLFILVSQLK